MRLRLLWQMKVEDGLAQREIHARMQAQQAEQVRPSPCHDSQPEGFDSQRFWRLQRCR